MTGIDIPVHIPSRFTLNIVHWYFKCQTSFGDFIYFIVDCVDNIFDRIVVLNGKVRQLNTFFFSMTRVVKVDPSFIMSLEILFVKKIEFLFQVVSELFSI